MTGDKGREKGALREVEALLEELMGNVALSQGTSSDGGGKDGGEMESGNGDKVEDEDGGQGDGGDGRGESGGDIEKDILAELQEMRGGHGRGYTAGDGANENGRGALNGTRSADTGPDMKLGLITLDIPCVSFVRLPSSSATLKASDPVDLVYRICREAHSEPLRPRSRFIKRLTPLTRVRKVMNDGVERLCEEVLPPVFGMEQGRQWRYAVRVTVRNNNQVSKDDIIKRVAGFVGMLGRGESTDGGEGKDAAREEVDRGNTSSEDDGDRAHLDNKERDQGRGRRRGSGNSAGTSGCGFFANEGAGAQSRPEALREIDSGGDIQKCGWYERCR